jgi:acyl-CoA thioester hydrolase
VALTKGHLVSPTPIVFKSAHRIRFSDLDPYNHMSTAHYATYFVDHRMQGLRDFIGWDSSALGALPFMVWVRRLEIDYVRPVQADQEIVVTSFVREFKGSDALIECTMVDTAGAQLSRCVMTVAHIDKATRRATAWPPERMALFFAKEA